MISGTAVKAALDKCAHSAYYTFFFSSVRFIQYWAFFFIGNLSIAGRRRNNLYFCN